MKEEENTHMVVSGNRGTQKSSILVGFSVLNHPFWGTPMYGKPHILLPRLPMPFMLSPFQTGVTYHDVPLSASRQLQWLVPARHGHLEWLLDTLVYRRVHMKITGSSGCSSPTCAAVGVLIVFTHPHVSTAMHIVGVNL